VSVDGNDSSNVVVMHDIVVMHDREFALEEPSVEITLRILNCVGSLAMRAEHAATRAMKNPTNRAAMFGLLAVMHKDDLIRIGSAVLQFESDREGRKWLKEHGVKIAPLVKALLINVRLSEDLVEALRAFFDGIEGVGTLLNNLVPIPVDDQIEVPLAG
jgi:hypothetical protein